MNRSGYTDDCDDQGQFAMWRGQVRNAARGKRGQEFFRDLILALDLLPVKILVAEALVEHNKEHPIPAFCTLGAVGDFRGAPHDVMARTDSSDTYAMGESFDIAHQLAAEAMWMNDEAGMPGESDSERWKRIRAWAVKNLRTPFGL